MAREAIFIGYRRDDTADVAGRIFDALAGRFGRARIFKDVDNLRPGADFGAYIQTVLPRCRAVLALIGPNWLDSRDERGQRRLDDPHDWVRIEIETALNTHDLDVVPVLVNGARMPRAEDLPPSLHPLLRRHAAVIRRDPDFHDDVRRLAEALRASLRTGILDFSGLGGEKKRAEAGVQKSSTAWPAIAVISAALLGGGGWWWSTHQGAPAALTSASAIDGRWVGEGQECRYAMRLVIDGDTLNILAPGAPASEVSITGRGSNNVDVITADATYARSGANLVATLTDGSQQVFTPCP